MKRKLLGRKYKNGTPSELELSLFNSAQHFLDHNKLKEAEEVLERITINSETTLSIKIEFLIIKIVTAAGQHVIHNDIY